ncbi:hypothetical protein TERTU_3643 [Teredinibacter turnerae T7901]|uniref:Uncharacterized protein n=1 Tax=Teredinibacter turnerae (strain ATCC 39867 / T7901) TaxID=377629 RepID=C5BS35_TERTT|nr:hypothetical protein TERTU_3643 [Teredinibacter turnerae T7901]
MNLVILSKHFSLTKLKISRFLNIQSIMVVKDFLYPNQHVLINQLKVYISRQMRIVILL